MLPTHSATNSPAMAEAMNSESSSSTSFIQQPNFAVNSKLFPRNRNMFHLRRHMKDVRFTRDMELRMYNLFKQYSPFPNKSTPEVDPAYQIVRDTLVHRATTILLDKLTRFGRNPEVVDVVLHSDLNGQMVSRLHAEITAEPDPSDPTKFLRYSIADRSLNGTYVNDRRAPTATGELYLKKGDVIKFGHVNGASFKPGEYAIGNESEFIFTFEPAYEGYEYVGHTTDGNRIERKGPQAYIHIGAHSLLPHEFDLFSLVPKREADLSVIPYGAKPNAEQKRVEYIQPHSQLLSKADPKPIPDPTTTIQSGTFGTTSIPIANVPNPSIIPNMTNFNLLSDINRITSEIQAATPPNNEALMSIVSHYLKAYSPSTATSLSPDILQILQYLQTPQNSLHPSLSYFHPPVQTSMTIPNMNLALQSNLLRSYLQPSSNDALITAIRQLVPGYLNGHSGINTTGGMNSGSGANVIQALYASLQPNVTPATTMASVLAAAAAAAMVPPPSTSTTITPTTLPSSSSSHLAPADPRPIVEEKRKLQIPSPDNIASASSTTSEETVVTSGKNLASDLLYRDTIITPQKVEPKPEKISIDEKMIANVAKAAAAVAVGTHMRNSSGDEKVLKSPTLKSPTLKSPTVRVKKPRKPKADNLHADHIQETIDFVAKNTSDTSLDSEVIEQLNESFGKQVAAEKRKRKKRASENESGKHKENVLKILDDAVAEMDPDKQQQQQQQPQKPPKIEIHDPEPSTTNINGIKPETIDREQSSSGGSLILCETALDDPGLLNGSNADLLESKKPEELNLLNRRLSTGSKVGSKGRRKRASESESDSNNDDDDDNLLTYKQATRTKQQPSTDSASSDTRPRKKSTSVKSRVIKVPRSPVPMYKKGPERLPGHKSNEVARLLYDLEGSYMHCARKGDSKRERRNTGEEDRRNGSDEETEIEEESESRPSSSHHVPSKRKSSDRFSNSPAPAAKKSKDSQERENDSDRERKGSSDEDELASPPPKVSNGKESSRKGKRSKEESTTTPKSSKKTSKKAIIELEETDHHSQKSDSDSDEEEPTPKRRKSGKGGKKDTVKTPTSQKKKPGRQPSKPKKKPGRKAKDKNTFVEITNNSEWERCAFSACRHPRVDTTVNWVQCDDCDQWFHILCAFGRDDKSVLEEEFHCGCMKTPNPAPPTAVMA